MGWPLNYEQHCSSIVVSFRRRFSNYTFEIAWILIKDIDTLTCNILPHAVQRDSKDRQNFACLSCFKPCEGAIVHFADTAKTIIALCIKDLKMFGLETNFESTRPIPHHVETRLAVFSTFSSSIAKILCSTSIGAFPYFFAW